MREALIELTDIWKGYSPDPVLKGLNLTVEKASFISIRGKSGVGKTTLLKIIGLLEPPDKGDVKLLGKTVNGLKDNDLSNLRLHHIGFIYQFFNLIPSLTVQENIELPLALAGKKKKERKERALQLLHYFELESLAERYPESLSGGERQRTAVIRALTNNPNIILADEPTSSLDDENTELLMNLLRKINHENDVTIVMTTTDLYKKLPTDNRLL